MNLQTNLHPTTPVWLPSRSQKNEREQHTKQALIARFVEIYKQNNPCVWRWKGSSADFWQMVYLVYLEVVLFDSSGCPLSLKAISKKFCHLLHMKMVKNPSATAIYACARKGVKQPNIVKRYTQLMSNNNTVEVLQAELQSAKSIN